MAKTKTMNKNGPQFTPIKPKEADCVDCKAEDKKQKKLNKAHTLKQTFNDIVLPVFDEVETA